MKPRGTDANPLLVILLVVAGAILLRLLVVDVAVVQGRSMLPTLRPGARVLVYKAAYGLPSPSGGYLLRWGFPSTGQIVAARNPSTGSAVVKRVGAWALPDRVQGDRVYLLGDNPSESSDSREYGPIPVESVSGRVILLPAWFLR